VLVWGGELGSPLPMPLPVKQKARNGPFVFLPATGTSIRVVGIATIAYPLQPAATRTPAQQDQADKGRKSQSQYSRM
jgi:hypothetical protein